MNPLYSQLDGIAAGLLREFGAAAVLHTHGAAVFDHQTQRYTRQATQHHGVACLFGYDDSRIDGHSIIQGDVRIYLNRIDAVPQVDDVLVCNGTRWRIIHVRPVSPAGYDVLYVLQGRRHDV